MPSSQKNEIEEEIALSGACVTGTGGKLVARTTASKKGQEIAVDSALTGQLDGEFDRRLAGISVEDAHRARVHPALATAKHKFDAARVLDIHRARDRFHRDPFQICPDAQRRRHRRVTVQVAPAILIVGVRLIPGARRLPTVSLGPELRRRAVSRLL
jgi:hypothetical protein